MEAHHHHHRHHDHARQKSADTKLHGPSDDNQEHKKSSPPPAPPPPQSSSSSSSSKQQQVTISPASPPSSSSSPSHEFSFTISLHSSNNPTTTTTTTTNDNKKSNRNDNKSKTPPPSFAIDLSPADEIFFHGHLLPLHLLSHLPVSPRSSTNSLESFTLPIRDLSSSDDTQKPTKDSHNKNSTTSSSSTTTTTSSSSSQKTEPTTKGSSRNKSTKSTSFSLFGLGKWRRGYEFREREDKEKPKRKMRFEVSHVLKRYMRMVRPLLFFRGRRRESSTSFQLRRQPYSFSGILSSRNNSNKDLRGGRRTGEYSAPASMRTSPSNSGLLVATATLPSSASDSTMEELQAAIQAAIAHCKNSIAAEDHKLKC
ncbi:hypothetical protein TIFTF001_005155 [Ficus carica]|uniref:BRI1 kinase inhibitor 1 n=1 Tax=Ficus carica TaxID=3494 RepID=A0AA87ZE11_FICCA|nr:hypothetical protein TIFTF001_005155 [Ficus carica]